MIVTKFGGTSVADARAISRLVDIVRARRDERPIVVVSALAGVTDALIALARRAGTADETEIDAAVTALRDRHEEVAGDLTGGSAALEEIDQDVAMLRRELGCIRRRTATPAELDSIAGMGELWSSRLVAAALISAGLDGAWVDIRPIMVTDDRFTRATPYTQVLNTRARES